MNKTPIEWCDFTANPLRYRTADGKVVWACAKVSAECTHCYAEELARRYGKGGPFNAGEVAKLEPFLDDKELHHMLHATKLAGKRVFVNDMTDWMGDWVPDELLDRLLAVFAIRQDVTWQVLTKRAGRQRAYLSHPDRRERVADQAGGWWGFPVAGRALLGQDGSGRPAATRWPLPNVWVGVSAGTQAAYDERRELLVDTPAAVRYISFEPLLERIDVTADTEVGVLNTLAGYEDTPRIDWGIIGGESGSGARPCALEWVGELVRRGREAGMACFVKQLGALVVSEERTCGQDVVATLEPEAARRFVKAPNGEYWAWRAKTAHRKGGDPAEWPDHLRVREFPDGRRA